MSAFSLRLPSLPAEFQGQEPRRTRYKLQPDEPYPPKPDSFLNSNLEWITYWWLSEGRSSIGLPTLKPVGPDQPVVPGRVFFYQIRIPNMGNFQSEVTRVDFYLPSYGSVGYEGLALDPISWFTHRDPDLDHFKRATLASQAHVQLVWLEGEVLEAGMFDVIEAALRGEDRSHLARHGTL